MARKSKKLNSIIPFLAALIILAISSTAIISAARENKDIMYNIAEQNHEIALSAVNGPPTLENNLLQGRTFAIACEIAYMGKQLPIKYEKSLEVACDTLLLFNASCWVSCDR